MENNEPRTQDASPEKTLKPEHDDSFMENMEDPLDSLEGQRQLPCVEAGEPSSTHLGEPATPNLDSEIDALTGTGTEPASSAPLPSQNGAAIPCSEAGLNTYHRPVADMANKTRRPAQETLTHYTKAGAQTNISKLQKKKDVPFPEAVTQVKPSSVFGEHHIPALADTASPTPFKEDAASPTPAEVGAPTPTPAEVNAQTPTPAKVDAPTPTPAEVDALTLTPAEMDAQTPTPAKADATSPTPAKADAMSPTPAKADAASPTLKSPAKMKGEEPTLTKTDAEASPTRNQTGVSFSHSEAGVSQSTSCPSEGGSSAESEFDLDAVLQMVKDEDPEVVAFFSCLIGEGRLLPGDCGVPPDSKPAWVDDAQVRLGQRFAHKYFFGLMLAEVSSLFLLFSLPSAVEPLIFSRNSDSAPKAFQRYLSTVRRVTEWYSGDLWAAGSAAHQDLLAVRALHALYRRRLAACAPEERRRRAQLEPPLWTRGAAEAVREDFAPHGRAHAAALCPFFGAVAERHEWINQMEMSVTQFGFVALAVTYPERFGAGGASRAELSAFVHLWRVLGHLLGVEERFNFCAGGLDAVRRRSQVLIKRFFMPALASVDDSWEHMTRCVIGGVRFFAPALSYEVALAHLCAALEVPADASRVLRALSDKQRSQQRVLAFLLRWAPHVAPLRALLNWRLRSRLRAAHSHAGDAQWLREREQAVCAPQQDGQAAPRSPIAAWLSTFSVVCLSIAVVAVTAVYLHDRIFAFGLFRGYRTTLKGLALPSTDTL